MIPAMLVAHDQGGRTRLRPVAPGRPSVELERVARGLAAVPGVDAVSVSPRTGSIVVQHELALGQLVAEARARSLFTVPIRTARAEPMHATRTARAEPMRAAPTASPRRRLRRPPAPASAKETAAGFGGMGLLALGLMQIARREYLPAALPMLLHGFQLISGVSHAIDRSESPPG